MARTYFRLSTALIIIAAIALAAAFCLPCAAVAEGEESPVPYGDYMVNNNTPLSLYSTDVTSPKEIIQAPSTYFVSYSAYDATLHSLGYFKVKYGGDDYLVKATDLQSRCTRYDSDRYGALSDIEGAKSAYAITAADLFTGGNESNITVYSATYSDGRISGMTQEAQKINFDNIKGVQGIFTLNSSTYYRVSFTVIIFGNPINGEGYIAASDVTNNSYKALSISNIPVNDKVLSHIAAKDEELNNSPIITTPDGSGNDKDGDPQPTSNNLERIVLSIIIGVLCVAVVILIFRPSRKKRT